MRRTQTEVLRAGKPGPINFLAYFDVIPVASAALHFKNDYGYLMGGAVAPEYRGRGIYASLLAHRLKIIGEKSLPAVVHCLEHTSAPICLKMGFEKVCDIESYELKSSLN